MDAPAGAGPWPVLAGFHGYAEHAGDMLEQLRRIRGDRTWLLVSVQALHRFYGRGDRVVASWMTREDRELAIDDNVTYVAAVMAALRREYPVGDTIVYAGFSQGVAMAYRAVAAVHGRGGVPRAGGGIMLAGDIPPDVAPLVHELPPLLIGRGTKDSWYTEAKAKADADVFAAAGVAPQWHVFDGGHEWDESFVVAAGEFLDRIAGA